MRHRPKVQLGEGKERFNVGNRASLSYSQSLFELAFSISLHVNLYKRLIMKYFTFLLSMLVVSVAVAQKPLDRGIHKRTTGGVSFLFGDKKAKDACKTNVVAFENIYSLQPIAANALPVYTEPAVLLEAPLDLASAISIPSLTQQPKERTGRFLRPILRKSPGPVVGLNPERRLFRRGSTILGAPADSSAPYDWASIVGFVTGVLGFVVPLFWILGIVFGAIGMKRTKDGSLRGRGLAVAGFVCGVAMPALVLLLVGIVLGSL